MKYYDKVALTYDQRYLGAKGIIFNGLELELLNTIPMKRQYVLDVGTGSGRVIPHLLGRGALPIGGDVSMPMLRVARHRCSYAGKTRFVLHDALHLPFHSECFKLITCYGLFESITDIGPYLVEFHQKLLPEGYLLFTCHNADAWRRSTNRNYDVCFYNDDDIYAYLAQAGYKIITHRTIFFFTGRVIWGIVRLLKGVDADCTFARLILRIERKMSVSRYLGGKGRVHLVLAQKL